MSSMLGKETCIMSKNRKPEDSTGKVEVFCRFITKKGKRIYPKNAKFFHFWVTPKAA